MVTNEADRLQRAIEVVDSHVHVWQLASNYSWIPKGSPLDRDFDLELWSEEARLHNVGRSVLVQASPTPEETQFILRQARLRPDLISAVVAWADLQGPDATKTIESLAKDPMVRSIRPWLSDQADSMWILSSALTPAISAIQSNELVLDILARPEHLPAVLLLNEQHPQLTMIIDHAAKPSIATGQYAGWAQALSEFADRRNVFCKLSGLLTEAGVDGTPETIAPYVEHVLGTFGPRRVMWGSDWPVVTQFATYGGWLDMARVLVPHEAQPSVFAETARLVYGLADPGLSTGLSGPMEST